MIKQLTFIHKQQLTPEERLSYVKVLQNNTVQCMITLVREAEAFGYSFTPEERSSADAILAHDQRVNMPYDLIVDIDRLWQSEAIQLTYARRNEYWHLEATEYYFANAERYVSDGFVPAEEDMVMARKRTTGVVVTELDYGGVHWSCVDVGGQRSERRKWLNCFDNVKAIVYVVNLAGYCKVLFEDKAVNRMHESLNLFEATMSNPLFAHTPVFIFLNKKDLFEQLIRDRNIDCCFPDYQGPNDLHSCIEYISEEYQRRLPALAAKPTFLLLAARMKKDVQYCFEEVKDILLDSHKKSIVKAKKALERVEKRNKEAGLSGVDDSGEGAKDADGGKYKVRGLQGWEATRKPAKVVPKRTLPATKSNGATDIAAAADPAKAKDEAAAESAAAVTVEADAAPTAAPEAAASSPASSSISPSAPLASPIPAASSSSSSSLLRDGGGEATEPSTTLNIQSAAVHAPRASQSSGLQSALTTLATPRTEVRIRGRSDGVEEEEEGDAVDDGDDGKGSAKRPEETKEMDDRDALISTTHSRSDAIIAVSHS